MILEADSDIVKFFQHLGETDFDIQTLDAVEEFICTVYTKTTNLKHVNDLRWELFKKKNIEGEKLPPTMGSLKPHIQRANIIAKISKGYKEPRPVIPQLLGNGWEEEADGKIVPTKCLELPAPQALIELVKCGCKGNCKGNNCSCLKNNLFCTALCKCNDCDNTKDYSVNVEENPEDDEQEEELE